MGAIVFAIGFIPLMFVARIVAEVIVNKENKKQEKDVANAWSYKKDGVQRRIS